MLALYQSRLMPMFPFVVIPPGTNAEDLKAEKPFLFAATRMAASIFDIRSMRGQMYQLVQRISQEILISSARSMDLLQAMLVMLGWFQNHCVMHAQLNNLLHLAQAHLGDMGMNYESEVKERTNTLVLNPRVPPPRKNEDKRAALGVWFLTSL